MLVLIFIFKANKKPQNWFSQFLCTERQQTGLQNTQIHFWLGGFAPLDPPVGHCLCTPLGPRWPLDPGHLGSVLRKHYFQFPCLNTQMSHLNFVRRKGVPGCRKPDCAICYFVLVRSAILCFQCLCQLCSTFGVHIEFPLS